MDRIRHILQVDVDFRHALASETLVTSNDDILQRVREYKSIYENRQSSTDQNPQSIIDEFTKQIQELNEESIHQKQQLKALTLLVLDSNEDNGMLKKKD